jgi:hypothetical protein
MPSETGQKLVVKEVCVPMPETIVDGELEKAE